MYLLPIVPYEALETVVGQDELVFAEVQYCFDDARYKEWMMSRRVLLDNSTYLSGQPIDTDSLWSMARQLDRCIVVAPDVIGDASQTLSRTQAFMRGVRTSSPAVMVCPQGRSYQEYADCYEALLQHEPDAVGILKDVNFCVSESCPCQELSMDQRTRQAFHRESLLGRLCQERVIRQGVYHHAFGMNTPDEFWSLSEHVDWTWLRSSDTAKPYKLAKAGLTIGQWDQYKGDQGVRVDEVVPEPTLRLTIENVAMLRIGGLLS